MRSPIFAEGFRATCAMSVFARPFLLMIAKDPTRYRPSVDLAIGGMLVVGLVCLIDRWAVHMRPAWCLADVAFCWVPGGLMLRYR